MTDYYVSPSAKREIMHAIASLMVADHSGDVWDVIPRLCAVVGVQPPDYDRWQYPEDDDEESEFDRFFNA